MLIASVLSLTRYRSADGTASITSHRIKSDYVCLLILTQTQSTLCCAGLWGGRSGLRANGTAAVGPPDQSGLRPEPARPAVQQDHSVQDYHTCGSGINPSTDMGTRAQDGGQPHHQEVHG